MNVPIRLRNAESELGRRFCLTPVLGHKKFDSQLKNRGISRFNKGATSPLDSKLVHIPVCNQATSVLLFCCNMELRWCQRK